METQIDQSVNDPFVSAEQLLQHNNSIPRMMPSITTNFLAVFSTNFCLTWIQTRLLVADTLAVGKAMLWFPPICNQNPCKRFQPHIRCRE